MVEDTIREATGHEFEPRHTCIYLHVPGTNVAISVSSSPSSSSSIARSHNCCLWQATLLVLHRTLAQPLLVGAMDMSGYRAGLHGMDLNGTLASVGCGLLLSFVCPHPNPRTREGQPFAPLHKLGH